MTSERDHVTSQTIRMQPELQLLRANMARAKQVRLQQNRMFLAGKMCFNAVKHTEIQKSKIRKKNILSDFEANRERRTLQGKRKRKQ